MPEIAQIRTELERELAIVSQQKLGAREALLRLRTKYLGDDGLVTLLVRSVKTLSAEEKRTVGRAANDLKRECEEIFAARHQELEQAQLDSTLANEWIDWTARSSIMESGQQSGAYHPVTIVQRECENIFLSMGFEILDGPHIETDYYNFEALNIPADHPARDMQDTFWFADKLHLLRTQTSAVQVRGMELYRPPFRFIAPGKVFRSERTDASHEMVFHQLEGMMVGEGITVGNLIYFMQTILTEIFKRNVEVRLRPGFFPFVEPGFELDIRCLICDGKGCSVCKHSGWVELLPCGMVHPAVLRFGKIDPEKASGFAFGMGLDRLVMMKYLIDDIRLIHSGELRFSSQFQCGGL